MAAVFKDRLGREWRLTIDNGAIDRARLAGVDPLSLIGEGGRWALGKLVLRRERLVKLLFALVQPDAARLGVSKRDFSRELTDAECHVLGEAIRALIEALNEYQRELIRLGSALLNLKT